ncbi:uncharacterized protein T551_02046 [Pneumocystis jirovecii RU7]|uniref:Uncharacterized protein n=1 Tax=Pneumocystis jirovecii (strain RU7) TaxID=1408657 RepID=A0A0W4ZP24_PNEJ7|nr:uncharacterized protein T551_02046 [Pneumocystis jirovecii RU7]KTW30102.1 hypothetical protein T551_02046 [Pneumocystis jirovecii RU7]
MKFFKSLITVYSISRAIASNLKNNQYIKNITTRNLPQISINTNITDDPIGFELSRIIFNGKRTNVTVGIKNLKNETLLLESFSIDVYDVNFSLPIIKLGDIRKRVTIAGTNTTKVSFYFSTELAERDYGLTILAKIRNAADFFTYVAYNSTIIVKEPEHSFFNLQTIFLYVLLISIMLGPYLIFRKWLSNNFQKKRKNRKKINEKKELEKTSNLHYDENWIPEHHLKNRAGISRKA